MRIYLSGFMGAGKTALGAELARRHGVALYDSDLLLERKWHLPAGVQLQDCPVTFRKREAEVVGELARLPQGVVALGGGVVEDEGNRRLLAGLPVLWLDPGPAVCWHRVRSQPQFRPLAGNYQDFVALYQRRLPLYRSCSRWRIGQDLPVAQLADLVEVICI